MDPLTLGLIGGGLGAIGGLFGRKEADNQRYLEQGWNRASSLLNSQRGYNPYEKNYFQQGSEFYGNTAPQISQDMINQGRNLLGSFGQAQNFASSYQPAQASIDFDKVAQYANNPYVNQMIDASSRDVTRNLTENLLPQYRGMASSTGNLGGSRLGIAEGVATRGTADRIGDISADIRSNLYNRGLSTEENLSQSNADRLNQLAYQRAMMGQNLGSTGLGAIGTGYGMGSQNIAGLGSLGQYYREAPWQTMSNYSRAIGNPVNYQPSKLGSIFSGAFGGLSSGLSTANYLNNMNNY
jgi:hypothetical protein